MNMEIKLLDNNKGVILTRQPELIYGNLYITFTGAPEFATVIFERKDGESLYRSLEDGLCGVPESFLQDEIKITVTLIDGTVNPQKWACEGLKITKQKKGGVLVAPNDMNIPEQMVELQLELQEMREREKIQSEKISELNTKLEKLLEGYDIT